MRNGMIRVTMGALAAGVVLATAAMGTASAAATAKPAPPAPAPDSVKITNNEGDLTNMRSLKPGAVQPNHVSGVDSVWYDSEQWGANVRIDYGSDGAWTKCSDGSIHYGPRVGPGYWKFGGNCFGYGTLTDFGIYGD